MRRRLFAGALAGLLLTTTGVAAAQDTADATEVAFDIKPRSCPNPVNVRSKGRLPAAVLGSETLDVTTIDVSTLLLEGVVALKTNVEDVAAPAALTGDAVNCDDCGEEGPDGYPDLTLQFDTQDLLAAIAPVEDDEVRQLTLTGSLLDGTPISGMDVICIKQKGTDFDDDGEVGFKDFIRFALHFGRKKLDIAYDERFDLDDDGEVTFDDFLGFVHAFAYSHRVSNGQPSGEGGDDPDDGGPGANGNGRGSSGNGANGNGNGRGNGGSAGKLAPQLYGANGTAGIALVALTSDRQGEMLVAVQVHGATQVAGYALDIGYDPDALTLIGSTGVTGSVFSTSGDPQAPAVQEPIDPGTVLLADALEPSTAITGDGTLAVLRFQEVNAGMPAQIEILSVSLADGDGLINTLIGTSLADARTGPAAYALDRNVPNPFNPVTQISYQLPEPGQVSLSVYNLLGQRVRVLVDEHQSSGSYRVMWDGRDDAGRGVSSGIYVLHMAANRFERSMKMLLLK